MKRVPHKKLSRLAVEAYDARVLNGEHMDHGAEDEATCKLAEMLDCVEEAVLMHFAGILKNKSHLLSKRAAEIASHVRPVWDLACKKAGLDPDLYREGAFGPSTDFVHQYARDRAYEENEARGAKCC